MRDRRGFALLAALGLLVAMSAVGLAVALRLRVSRLGAANVVEHAQALAAAEGGAAELRARLMDRRRSPERWDRTETAEIATHAALTGHLVLSTLHTNDAASALTRLIDLGVAPYLIASTVQAVLAQRLVRTVCGDCSGAVQGCAECRGSGFRGRVGIYELLVMDAELQTAVMERRPAAALRDLALHAGMRCLGDDGGRLVALRRTTNAEVLRACGG